MTSHDDLDRRLAAWLDQEYVPRAPIGLLESTTGRVARTRRLPGWATTERWFSMESRAMFGAVPRVVIILVTIGLLAALTAGTIAIGAAVSTGSPNGLIVYQHDSGDLWTVRPDGSDSQPLIESDATLAYPSWSPDGSRLATGPPPPLDARTTSSSPRPTAATPSSWPRASARSPAGRRPTGRPTALACYSPLRPR